MTIRQPLQDALFLTFVVLISCLLYVPDLGFYSDDWAFLSFLSNAKEQSLSGLFYSLYSNTTLRMRPVQVMYLSVLYKLFGTNPQGYHLVNAMVMVATAILFYLCLRQLNQSRLIALSLPVVYALLPHYSTNRFWVAAFQTSLSMALYFLSLYSDLKALHVQSGWLWGWKALSLISLLGSILAYEVALPLFFLNALVVWLLIRRQRQTQGDSHKRVSALLWISNLIALLLVIAFKVLTTARNIIQSDYTSHIVSTYNLAFLVDYIGYGIALPHVAWKAVHRYPDKRLLLLGLLLVFVIFCYLYRAISETQMPNPRFWAKLLGFSFIVFVLGYAVFISTRDIQFHKTGIANRVSIAAALGVAMTIVAAIGLLSVLLLKTWLQKVFYCLAISFVSLCGFLINNSIASFWTAAYQQEKEILADITQQFSTLPTGSILILDGVCPYNGPAIVFESGWDLAGALRVHYRNPALRADVVKRRLEIGQDGLYISIYSMREFYPYSENLIMYNYNTKTVHRLTSVEDAHRYFQKPEVVVDNNCPDGEEGLGVDVF